MASLKSLVASKNLDNYLNFSLEKGKVYAFTAGAQFTPARFCWRPCAAGIAIVEVWGPGGGSSRMCCCGASIPGNSGAYAKKVYQISTECLSTTFLCGCIGHSSPRTDDLCRRRFGHPTLTQFSCNNGTTWHCMCAETGRSGISICMTDPGSGGTSDDYACFQGPWTCFTNNCFCGEAKPWGAQTNCGIVCNHRPTDKEGQAYGGDVNCPSRVSKVDFTVRNPNHPCSYHTYLASPAGMYSTDGAYVLHGAERDNVWSRWSGAGVMESLEAIASLSREPSRGIPWTYCWGAGSSCGCYENQGCIAHMPIGWPGPPVHQCPNVRDVGTRGGPGGVRVRFIACT